MKYIVRYLKPPPVFHEKNEGVLKITSVLNLQRGGQNLEIGCLHMMRYTVFQYDILCF